MGKQLKLLIIDDSKLILTTFSKFFKKKNYSVTTASNGLDGLKLLENQNETFDLIITDIIIPNISGIGVISIIKKKYPNMPVIAITGWGEHPEALAVEAQADHVLEKPIQLSELDKIVTQLLSTKG